MALLRDYDAPEARKAFGEQVAESRKGAKVWTETHPRPVMEQYGVAWKPFKLPTPDAMLEVLDKDGYITAAIQVAKGVATGSPGATIEGFGKLAPKNSSLRVAANGVAAAMRGDVMGTADAVIELAGRQPDVAPIADRLKRVQSAVGDVKAGVAWYGHMVRKEGSTAPKHPVEVASAYKGRMLGLYGELDKGIQQTQIEAMRKALKEAGDTKSEIVVYPGADHGFLADYRPSYNETAAKDAWARCLTWFKSHGV